MIKLQQSQKESRNISQEIGLDEKLTYRLLRALASLSFLKEHSSNRFSISSQGELLRKDHPQSLSGILLLEEGTERHKNLETFNCND